MQFLIKSALLGSMGLMAYWVMPPSSASAFDCSKAATKTEFTICNNPELLEADKNMEQAFFSMLRGLDKKPADLLRQGQRDWLKFRETSCEGESACLIDEDKTRLKTLNEISRMSPQMVPVFFWQEGTNTTYTIRLDLMKFAYPDNVGLALFNREIDKVISLAPLSEQTEEQTIGAYDYEALAQITQLTDNMVSALVSVYEYSGGAHPNSYSTAINIDLSSGKLLKIKDIFSVRAIEKLSDDCRAMIIADKAEMRGDGLEKVGREFDEEYGKDFTRKITNTNAWHFNENGATITFNAYDIGPYVEGDFTCEFPAGILLELSTRPELIRR